MTGGAPAEIPGVIAGWAHPSNYGSRPAGQAQPYDEIVIHITSGHPDALGDVEMWQKPRHLSSAHLVIGQDATAYQCVPLRFSAWHAHAANGHSVGVEHSAREPGAQGRGDPGMPPTPEQLRKSAGIVAYLLKAGGLSPVLGVTIKGHAAADPDTTHEKCPDGAPWPWPEYMQLVNDAYAALGAAEVPNVA